MNTTDDTKSQRGLIPLQKALAMLKDPTTGRPVVGRSKGYRMAKSGELPCVQLGKLYFMTPQQIDDILSGRLHQSTSAALAEQEGADSESH